MNNRVNKTKQKNTKKIKPVSLKWRIVFYLFVFVALIIGVLWLLQSVFLDDIYMNIKTNSIKNNAQSVISILDTDQFQEKTITLSKKEKTCIFVYNLTQNDELISCEGIEGRCDLHALVYHMFIFEFQINLNNVEKLVSSAKENGGSILYNVNSRGMHSHEMEFSTDFKRNDKNQSALLVYLCQNSNGDEIVLMFNSVISPMAETVNTLNTLLAYISILLIFLAILFSLIISFLVTKPLTKMGERAKELAKGNYNVNFEGEGYSEVSELADTLNFASSRLSKLDRLKSELIANISHDLRTPITLISGYAEAMKDFPEEMTKENLQIIIDESGRMTDLVNQILDFSKLQSGNIEFNMEDIMLTECIENELIRYNKLRNHEGYHIEFKYTHSVMVSGDATRITQVLYNLVNNAVVHTGADKKVTVTQTIKNNRVRISVIDTGSGIPKEQLASIWERYYKVNKNLNREQSGTGLGLSIVKAIIEAHHGLCGVDSTPGKGSSFWFELDIKEIKLQQE